MAIKIDINVGKTTHVILGLDDIRKKMLSLPGNVGRNVARRGLLAGAGVIRDEAKRLVPKPPGVSRKGNVRSGLLERSIVAETKQSKTDLNVYEAVVTIRPPKRKGEVKESELNEPALKGEGANPRAYGHLVEFGTRPHAVGAGSDLELTIGRKRTVVGHGKQVGPMHPGTEPQPFMRPAYDTKQLEALNAIVETTRKELDKELRKMAPKKRAG